MLFRSIRYFSIGLSEIIYGAISNLIAQVDNQDEQDRLVCLQAHVGRLTNPLIMDIPASTYLLNALKHLIYICKQLEGDEISVVLGKDKNQTPSLRQLHHELQQVINNNNKTYLPLEVANTFIKPLQQLLVKANQLQLPENQHKKMLAAATLILSPWLIKLDEDLQAGNIGEQLPDFPKQFFTEFSNYMAQNKKSNRTHIRQLNLSSLPQTLFNQ